MERKVRIIIWVFGMIACGVLITFMTLSHASTANGWKYWFEMLCIELSITSTAVTYGDLFKI